MSAFEVKITSRSESLLSEFIQVYEIIDQSLRDLDGYQDEERGTGSSMSSTGLLMLESLERG